MQRLKAIMQKEFWHVLRDSKSLMIVFAMPLLMLVIYGYAISFDLKHITLAVVDQCGQEAARELIRRFEHNDYFEVNVLHDRPGMAALDQAERALRAGTARCYLVIPFDFSANLAKRRTAQVGLLIDGSDSNAANVINQYADMIVQSFSADQLPRAAGGVGVQATILYNPELKSSNFFIPGIIAILLLMISALLTSLSVAREKESGSIDLLFISPLRSGEIIVGKTIPYVVVALGVATLILLCARFWFDIPIRGSLVAIYGASLIYIVTGLALGILISTAAADQKLAMLATLLITMLPSIMLSGFIFPLESLPGPLRAFSYIVPATYYLQVVRGLILKGSHWSVFWHQGVVLVGFSLLWLTMASVRFQRLRRKTQ